jgi:DNA-binding SARP family transcriptional activator
VGLTARLLGDFRLDGVDLPELRSRKARQLVKRLALEGGAPVHPDRLVLDLWEDAPPAAPGADLAVLASRARKVVGADNLVRTDGGYALHLDACDRDEVVALVREAAERLRTGDADGARTRAEAALGLVPGPLLADEPDAPWTEAPRAAMDAQVALARQVAAQAAYLTGRLDDAVAHAQAAIDASPYDEVSLRWQMRAHQAAGRAGAALAAYAAMQLRLRDDLGADPDRETARLHAAVLAGRRDHAETPVSEAGPVVVGREREHAILDEQLDRSRERGAVLLVSGEPGIGKTVLARSWSARARARGVAVLAPTTEPGAGLQPLADAVLGATSEPGPDADAALLRQLFAPDAAPSGWEAVPGPAARVETVRHRVYAALARLLDRAATPTGLALVLDDLDLADDVLQGWVGHVAGSAEQHRFLVIGLWRGVGTPNLPATARFELSPLDEAAVADLVGRDRATALWQRSGGNPLLLSELAAAGDDGVPLSLRELVVQRLADAGDAGPTLRAAAVLGAEVDLDLLARVTELSPSQVLDHLEQGLRLALVVEDRAGLRFRHGILREAIEAETSTARQSWIHARAAELLAERPDANPVELARHARLGANPRLVARGLVEAAERARRRFDLAGAESLLDEAIAADDGWEVRTRRSRVRMALGDFAGADDDAVAALGEGGGAEALELRAWAARNRHDMEAAVRLGRAGANLAVDPATKASCLLAVAFAHRGTGDLRAADRVLDEALALPDAAVGVAAWSGVLRTHQGRPGEALATLEPLLGADSGGLHSFWVEHMLQMTAHAYGMAGRPMDALAVLDRLERELERRGSDGRYGGMPDNYRSWIHRNLGVPGAVDLADAVGERAPMGEVAAQSRLDVVDALLLEGRHGEAVTVFDTLGPRLTDPMLGNRWRCEQRALLLAARLHLATGDPESALTSAEHLVEAAEQRGDQRYAVLGRLVRTRARSRSGQGYDEQQTAADLDRLVEVAALEAWWVAAEVAADTGLAQATAVADSAATRLLARAGPHRPDLERTLGRRLS